MLAGLLIKPNKRLKRDKDLVVYRHRERLAIDSIVRRVEFLCEGRRTLKEILVKVIKII